jgi:hypothetical protein
MSSILPHSFSTMTTSSTRMGCVIAIWKPATSVAMLRWAAKPMMMPAMPADGGSSDAPASAGGHRPGRRTAAPAGWPRAPRRARSARGRDRSSGQWSPALRRPGPAPRGAAPLQTRGRRTRSTASRASRSGRQRYAGVTDSSSWEPTPDEPLKGLPPASSAKLTRKTACGHQADRMARLDARLSAGPPTLSNRGSTREDCAGPDRRHESEGCAIRPTNARVLACNVSTAASCHRRPAFG